MSGNSTSTIWGLDLGASSIGWAILSADIIEGKPQPTGIIDLGSRIFPSAFNGDFEKGIGATLNTNRRIKRSMRRQTERRSARKLALFRLLQESNLLPTYPDIAQIAKSKKWENYRDRTIKRLDKELVSSWRNRLANEGGNSGIVARRLPYILRARAVTEKVDLHHFGRALYHLGSRRGFLSLRKGGDHDDEENAIIHGTRDRIGARELDVRSSNQTLGQYFAERPSDERIRGRYYTLRKMYQDEFNRIWNAQRFHYPEILTDDLKKKIHNTIFHQRPVSGWNKLVGPCSLLPKLKRAPMASFEFQRFRLLKMVNETRFEDPATGEIRGPDKNERSLLVKKLERQGHLTLTEAKSLIGLPRHKKFIHPQDKFIGNQLNASFRKVFGDARWDTLSPDQREAVLTDCRTIDREDSLIHRAIDHWKLSAEQAVDLATISISGGHAAFSRKGLKMLLPEMENGCLEWEAIRKVFGRKEDLPAFDILPPAREIFSDVRNPVVMRALSELRRVCNALIRKYGKPEIIRIELARDLANSKKKKRDIQGQIRKNTNLRREALLRFREVTGREHLTARDFELYKLWKECERTCPYTFQPIPIEELFSRNSPWQIEHIIPFSRCFDDSFVNKTLCYHHENTSRVEPQCTVNRLVNFANVL